MTIQLPIEARFTIHAALSDRLCRFWPLRNSPDRCTRIVARASIRQLVEMIRQLLP